MYRIAYLLIISFFIIGCGKSNIDEITLPYYNEPTFTPIFAINQSEVEKKITHTIKNFSFLNQDNILINQETIENKIHIANFVFTSCNSICPTMTKNLKIVSDSLSNSKNLIILSFSVMPWVDKPNVLKKYKQDNEIENNNWHFLTGNKAAIYKLARESYFAEEDIGYSKDSSEFLHTEHFVLVDKNKRIRGIYNGTLQFEMQQLIDDVRILEKEE